jgi:hypothetical protein
MFRALHLSTGHESRDGKEGVGTVTTRAAVGLWSPTNESAQGIGATLREHWAAAKQVAAASPFFRRSGNWLEVSRRYLSDQPVRATSHAAPAIAATSDVAGMKRL